MLNYQRVCFEYSPSKEIVVQTLQETPHQEFIAVFADFQCRKSHPPPCRLGVPRCPPLINEMWGISTYIHLDMDLSKNRYTYVA
jgi:hypothetical protein